MRQSFETTLFLVYLCKIKVENNVVFQYKGSIFTRYKHYVYVEVYVNLKVKVIKKFKFLAFLNYEYNDVR